MEAIWVAMQHSLGKSMRKAALELETSLCLIQRILHSDLKLFLYKMSVLHKLSGHDKGRRPQFTEWAQEENGFWMRPIFIWSGL
jgi:hypothetical protein